MIDARSTTLGLLFGMALFGGAAVADEPLIQVYKTPTCGCCTKWVSHLRENGFEVETTDLSDLRMVKSMAGIAPDLASCHTGRVDGYVIEGHVPAQDIRRLLAERPDALGLTVPGMPHGSPGMESPHPEPYQVLLIGEDGSTSVFETH